MRKQESYLLNDKGQTPQESKMPDLGINVGNMRGGFYSNVLSENASDIESNLLSYFERIR